MPTEPGRAPDAPATDPLALRRQAELLRASARRLRQEADELPELLRRTAAYDRDDVWAGARAEEFRAAWHEIELRVVSPWSGVVTGLQEAAHRLDVRAVRLDAEACLPPRG